MNLSELRASKGLTQDSVSIMAGISRAAYANIEAGRRRPSPETAKKIGSCLGFDWTRFYDEKPINVAQEAV